jgi:hypothetical protein
MPKVTFTNAKGLVQQAGSGFDLTSMGTGQGPNIKVPVVSLEAATKAVTVAESGTIFVLNKADGIVVTLPSATAGLVYEFYVETALTSNNYSIVAASSADTLTGLLMSWDIADVGSMTKLNENVTTAGWSNPAAADYQLVTNKTTTGGLKGSYWKYTCVSDTLWHVEGINICSSGATIATPFDGA